METSFARIVAVDASGAIVERGALMDRLGDLELGVLTRRVFDVVLEQQGGQPLAAGERSSQLGTDAQWSTVRDPRIESGSLIFFTFRGEMSPELVEHRVRIDGWQLSTRPADELVVATDGPVSMGDATCHAIARCGCWSGCARIEPVRMPEGQAGTHRIAAGVIYEDRCEREEHPQRSGETPT